MKYLLLLLLTLSARIVGACDCANPPMQKAYQMADYVVQGRVYGSVLHIDKVFKGRISAKKLTLTAFSLDCKFYFGLGAYIVFLNDDKAGGYVASPCQKHFPLTDTASLKAFRLVSK